MHLRWKAHLYWTAAGLLFGCHGHQLGFLGFSKILRHILHSCYSEYPPGKKRWHFNMNWNSGSVFCWLSLLNFSQVVFSCFDEYERAEQFAGFPVVFCSGPGLVNLLWQICCLGVCWACNLACPLEFEYFFVLTLEWCME